MTPHELRALIDRISDALGPDASPERVESIARAVIQSGTQAQMYSAGLPPAVGSGPVSGRIIVTAFGCDRPGILASITGELFNLGVNVLDVSQKILQEYFTLILLADVSTSAASPGDVQQRLSAHADRLGVRIIVQHEEIFQAMRRV